MENRPKRQSTIDKDYRERKRIRKDKEASPAETEGDVDKDRVQAECQQLYNYIKECRDPEDDEHFLSDFFVQLPSKRQYPDYYQVIKHPIALSKIKTKIDQQEYTAVTELKSDIDLMVSNAKKYNIKESQVYQDAVKLQKLVKNWTVGKEKEKRATTSSETKLKTVLKLPGGAFSQSNTLRATDDQQRQQSHTESKVKAIRLKAVDKHPKKKVNLSDLMEAIAAKNTKRALGLIDDDPTLNLNQLKEVEMFNDKFSWSPLHAACYYGLSKVAQALLDHGAGIEVKDTWYSATPLGWAAFGDNDKLVRLLLERYGANREAKNIHGQIPYDLVSDKEDPRWEGVLKAPYTIKARSPQKKSSSNDTTDHADQSHAESSSEIDAVNTQKKRRGRPPKTDKEAHDDRMQPAEQVDLNNFDPVQYMKELFHGIQTHTNNAGRLYSEMFDHLPDKEEYPDYYEIIEEPRSLSIIEDKMKRQQYSTLSDWFKDMELVFDNAMEYNEPGSRVYRDAKLLLRLLNRTKEKILSREGIPLTQERHILNLSLADRPYEMEDKRRTRRSASKSKSLSDESTPAPESTPATMDASPIPPQPPHSYGMMNMPAIIHGIHPTPTIPPIAPHGFNVADAVVPGVTPQESLPLDTVIQTPEQNGHLPNASQSFFELFSTDIRDVRPLKEIVIRSMNETYETTLVGNMIGHSVTVPRAVQVLKISPVLQQSLQDEPKRISITVLQDNTKLDSTEATRNDTHSWRSIPLHTGLNTIKISVTANVSTPNASGMVFPEYRTQVYILFITQSW
ncbi:Bromodomain-containing protein [Lichtheimia hyalospora FSU 10163]|nr:Bromodomain-containing protein [Lichtheimia hyalospora FSU 10163]